MPKTTVKTEIVEPDNAPGVIAYRVAQLEKTVITGFKEHNEKLDTLVNNFASKEEVRELMVKVAEHSREIKGLTATDNRQQGAIDTSRRLTAAAITILGIIVTALSIYFGVHK